MTTSLRSSIFFSALTLLVSYYAHAQIVVGVTSDKSIKVDPVLLAFQKHFPGEEITIEKFKTKSGIPEQPISRKIGELGAINRLEYAKQEAKNKGTIGHIQYWVSIENFLEDPSDLDAQDIGAGSPSEFWHDRAAVVVEGPSKRLESTVYSEQASLNVHYVTKARAKGRVETGGFSATAGEIIACETGLPSGNWHKGAEFGGRPRDSLIECALTQVLDQMVRAAQ